MTTHTVSLGGLKARLLKDMQARERRVRKGAEKAAKATARHVRREAVPVAHGELRDSIRGEATEAGARVVADAPHAEDVEIGARPHVPPIGPLIEWVKLRGMQGILSTRQTARLPGTTTRSHAASIAGQIKAMERGGAVPVDAPERIAHAIQQAIAKRGTRPHWYMREGLPVAMSELDKAIQSALGDQ